MKPESEKKLIGDQKTFEELPAKTREALLLGEKAEKATGKERAAIDREIKPQPAPAQQ